MKILERRIYKLSNDSSKDIDRDLFTDIIRRFKLLNKPMMQKNYIVYRNNDKYYFVNEDKTIKIVHYNVLTQIQKQNNWLDIQYEKNNIGPAIWGNYIDNAIEETVSILNFKLTNNIRINFEVINNNTYRSYISLFEELGDSEIKIITDFIDTPLSEW